MFKTCLGGLVSLTCLSLGGTSITDSHVKSIVSTFGNKLELLELINCADHNQVVYHDRGFADALKLTSASAMFIARHCNKLKSLALVDTMIDSAGLREVLSSNPLIVTLNISSSMMLTVDASVAIAQYSVNLKELRVGCWCTGEFGWLGDEGFATIVDAAKRNSGGLKLIGLEKLDNEANNLTIRGISYAVENGLETIEVCGKSPHYEEIVALNSQVKYIQPPYSTYVNGSHYAVQNESHDPHRSIRPFLQ